MQDDKTGSQNPEEIMKQRQELEKKLGIAIRIYNNLKLLKEELIANEAFRLEGNMVKPWEFHSLNKEDAWIEKGEKTVKVIYKFTYKNAYEQYFAVYGIVSNKLPYVEVKKADETVFKAEIDEKKLSNQVNLLTFNPQDEWYKALLNNLYLFETEVQKIKKEKEEQEQNKEDVKKKPDKKEEGKKNPQKKLNIFGAITHLGEKFTHKDKEENNF